MAPGAVRLSLPGPGRKQRSRASIANSKRSSNVHVASTTTTMYRFVHAPEREQASAFGLRIPPTVCVSGRSNEISQQPLICVRVSLVPPCQALSCLSMDGWMDLGYEYRSRFICLYTQTQSRAGRVARSNPHERQDRNKWTIRYASSGVVNVDGRLQSPCKHIHSLGRGSGFGFAEQEGAAMPRRRRRCIVARSRSQHRQEHARHSLTHSLAHYLVPSA